MRNFGVVQGYYFTGDGCRRDEDGFYWITGRVDDVINVSGHRIGTAEVESALSLHPHCAEAAVVGSAIFFFIVHLHCLLLPVVFSLLLLPTLWVSILTEADVVVSAIFFFIVPSAAMSSSSCCIAFLLLLLCRLWLYILTALQLLLLGLSSSSASFDLFLFLFVLLLLLLCSLFRVDQPVMPQHLYYKHYNHN